MRRIVSALFSACALLSLVILPGSAKAGDYYDDGYYRPRNSWSSSDCCYKKIVRHERSVHYRRLESEGYYDRPRSYERSSYYDRPYRRGYSDYETPRRYDNYGSRRYDDSYGSRRYDRYSGYSGYSGYSSYSNYADSCYQRSVPVADYRGGWVWGTKTRCY